MDDPSMTMEEYIRFEEEKARRRGRVFNWQTATYGKIRVDDNFHDLGSVETKFPAIVIDNTFASPNTLLYESKVSTPINNEIDFRISFDESDDEDYTIICDKNSFSYKMISVNDLKMDSENNYEGFSIPLFSPPEPTTSYLDDLDFLNDFENEFSAIVYNDAQMSKSDHLTEPILIPQHIDEFDLKEEASLSEFINTAYPGDLTEKEIDALVKEFTNLEILKCWSLETSRRLFNTRSCSQTQHGESTERIAGEFLILILINSRI
ncbi:hypothetical protein Tco_0671194 [Tanacetum coccineum]